MEKNNQKNILEEYEIINNLNDIIHNSSPKLSPKLSEETNKENLLLTLSPKDLSPVKSSIKSPLFLSIMEGCKEAGIKTPDKILSPKNNNFIYRIIKILKYIFKPNPLLLSYDYYNPYLDCYYMG